jgi:asparagine synthase (glutamine-hydrolysing)
VLARREGIEFEWLTPAARRAASAARAAQAAAEPRGVRARMAWMRGLRYLDLALAAIAGVAADADVELAHPLFDGGLWSTVAARGGFPDRTAGMTALFADVLPPDVLARRSKASFDSVFFNRHSRAFARTWDGTGAPAGLVDVEALRTHWLGAAPAAQTFTLLQALWLARDRLQQPLDALTH